MAWGHKNSPTLLRGDGLGHQESPTLLQGDGLSHQESPTLLRGDGLGHKNSPTLPQGDGLSHQESPTLLQGDGLGQARATNPAPFFAPTVGPAVAQASSGPRSKIFSYKEKESYGRWEKTAGGENPF